MPLASGQVLQNRYRIVKLLGQGGFGAVYRAWDLSLKAACAVKENLDLTTASQAQFNREARLLFNLRHSCLPQVRDLFEIPNQGQYLVMDYIEGEDLQAMLDRIAGPLAQEQVVTWLSQVCEVLTYLHDQNPPVIHRDIKPANIKITPGGKPVLVDFGIAKVYDPSLRTVTGARAVTGGYSPPEQYGSGITDARSDVYSLGATAYMLLTTQQPPDALQIIAGKISPPLPLDQINPIVFPGISKAVLQAMQPKCDDRFASARDFQAALQTGLHQKWKAAPTGSAPTQGGSRRRRTWILTGLVGLVITIVLGLGIGGVLLSPRTFSSAPGSTATPLSGTIRGAGTTQTSPGLEITATLTNDLLQSTSLTPTSTITPTLGPLPALRLPFPTPNPLSLKSISAINANQVVELNRIGKGAVQDLVWSQDEKLLAAATALGVYLLDAETLGEIKFIKGNPSAVDISPDGSLLATSDGRMIEFYDAAAGSLVRSIETNRSDCTSLSFSPDGSRLICGSNSGWSIWEASSGKLILERPENYERVDYSPNGKTVAGIQFDGTTIVWDAANGQELWRKTAGESYWGQIAYTPDGNSLAISYKDEIYILDIADGSQVGHIQTFGTIDAMAFSDDGATLLAFANNGELRTWSTESWNLLDKKEVTRSPNIFAFSPSSQAYAAVDQDGNLALWKTGQETPYRQTGQYYRSLDYAGIAAFSANSQTLALSPAYSENIHFWRVEGGSFIQDSEFASYSANSAVFSPDGDKFAGTSGYQDFYIWKLSGERISGSAQQVSSDFERPIGDIRFSADSLYLISISEDRLRWWSANDGALLRSQGIVEAAKDMRREWSPDGKIIAFSNEKGIRLWDVYPWEQTASIETKTAPTHIGFSNDSRYLAWSEEKYYEASGMASTSFVWDTAQKQQISTIRSAGILDGIVLSPDGSILAGSIGENIVLYRTADGSLLNTLSGHQGGSSSIGTLTFSPDGAYLVSKGRDGTFRIWGVR